MVMISEKSWRESQKKLDLPSKPCPLDAASLYNFTELRVWAEFETSLQSDFLLKKWENFLFNDYYQTIYKHFIQILIQRFYNPKKSLIKKRFNHFLDTRRPKCFLNIFIANPYLFKRICFFNVNTKQLFSVRF